MSSATNGRRDTSAELTLGELGRMDKNTFVAIFGNVFEHSPWVAEEAWRARPFDSADALHGRMAEALRNAGRDAQLKVICAHPDLAGKAAIAGEITDASKREQAGSGLGQLTPEEFARFQQLNAAYKAKFGFPFIMAVRGNDKRQILQSFTERLENSPEAEFDRAMTEIERIARLRVRELIAG